jgi:hypothetical protein
MGLRDAVADFKDVQEETITVPQWGGLEVLFRGITYVALQEMREVDIEAASNGDIDQGIRLLQATMYDPETGDLAFAGEEGGAILRRKGYEAILHCVTNGALVVLGADKGETAGKDSSSAETDELTPAV